MRQWTLPLSLLLCPVQVAAGQDRPARTDSADFEIIVNQAEDKELAWEFEEIYRLGSQDSGPEAFFQVNSRLVAVDGAGTINVLDPTNHTVSQFSATGDHVNSFGAEGGGPGEFRFPIQVVVDAAGNVAVLDVGKRALVRFAADGSDLAEVSIAHLGVNRGLAIWGDSVLMGIRHSPTPTGTVVDLTLMTEADTVVVASHLEPPSRPQEYVECGVRITLPPVFAKTLVWRHSGSTIALSKDIGYVIELHDDGRVLSIRRPIETLSASEQLASKEFGPGYELGIGQSRTCLIPTDELIEQAGMAEAVPSIRDLALAPDGFLWVNRWRFDDEERKTDIFTPEGAYVGTLAGDHPFPIAFLPNGDLLASEVDDFDVQRLVAYRVIQD